MYITKFICFDGHTEEYYYHAQSDAEHHMMLFVNDDSGLYNKISVCNEHDIELNSICF